MSISGAASPEKASDFLAERTACPVVKTGKDGALVRDGNRILDEGGDASAIAGAVEEIVGVLGVYDALEAEKGNGGLSDDEIGELVARRDEARRQKSFDEADAIRNQLDEAGVVLEDSPDGTRWIRK